MKVDLNFLIGVLEMIKKTMLFLCVGMGLILSPVYANGRDSSPSSDRGSHAPRGADRGNHEGQKNNDLLYGPRKGAYTVDGSGGDDYDDDDRDEDEDD